MGLFEDLSRFLENRLDEFLKANPHLELMALEEQLRGQEEDSINLLGDLKRRQQQIEDSILSTAQEIQRWHERIQKAEAANRQDLVQPAKARGCLTPSVAGAPGGRGSHPWSLPETAACAPAQSPAGTAQSAHGHHGPPPSAPSRASGMATAGIAAPVRSLRRLCSCWPLPYVSRTRA